MNSTHIPYPAQRWSAQLGELAGRLSENPGPPPGQPSPSNLSSMLANLFHRSRVQQHAMDKMKANEFLVGW